MHQERSRSAGRLLAVVLALGVAAPLAAQPVIFPAASLPDQASGGPVRQLSVNEAVQLALENNLGLRAQRLEPQLADESIVQIRTSWTPVLTSTFTNANTTNPVGSFLSGARDKLTGDDVRANVGASQQLPWGASYTVRWDNARTKNNSLFSSPNPATQSTINVSFSQPLLRNFKIDSARQQLQVATLTRENTDVALRQAILLTQRSVKIAYWNLAYANASLSVARQSLDLARELLRNNRARVEVGTMAPIDIVEAEAEVALREEAVIVAEAQVAQAEDALRTLIFDPASPDFWTVKIELTDRPTFEPQSVDAEAAVRNALAERTDLAQARRNIEMSDVNIRYLRNQLLPDVNVQFSYNVVGQGGKAIEFSNTFPPLEVGSRTVGYGNVLRQVFASDFPSWTVGLTFSYPLGTSSAEASLARARLQYTQSQIQLKNNELQVATQVRDITRQVNTNLKRVAATRASRELAQRRLEAEQKKNAAGMSTSFLVFQAQRDLAQAQTAELNAILEYNKSLVDFEIVQEVPLSGAGSLVSVAGTGSVISSGAAASSTATTTSTSRSRGGM